MTTRLENDMPVAYVMQAIDAPPIITRNGAGGTSSKEQRP